MARPASFTTAPGFPLSRRLQSGQSPTSTGDKGEFAVPRYPIVHWRRSADFSSTPAQPGCLYGELPNERTEGLQELVNPNHTMVNEQNASSFPARLSRRETRHPMAVLTGLVARCRPYRTNSNATSTTRATRQIVRDPGSSPRCRRWWPWPKSNGGRPNPNMYPKNDLSLGTSMRMISPSAVRGNYEPNDVLVRAQTSTAIFMPARPTTSRTASHVERCAGAVRAPTRLRPIAAGVACCGPAPRRRQRGGFEHAEGHPAQRRPRSSGSSSSRSRTKDSKVKLMGFGHRVYKTTTRGQAHARDLPRSAGGHRPARRPAVQLPMALEKIALEDDLFSSRAAVPERRLLFRHRAERAGHPGQPVQAIFAAARRWLDRAAQRDDRRPELPRSGARASSSWVRRTRDVSRSRSAERS